MHPGSDAYIHMHTHMHTFLPGISFISLLPPLDFPLHSNYISLDIYSPIRYDLSSSLLLIIALIIDRLVIHHEKKKYGSMTAD